MVIKTAGGREPINGLRDQEHRDRETYDHTRPVPHDGAPAGNHSRPALPSSIVARTAGSQAPGQAITDHWQRQQRNTLPHAPQYSAGPDAVASALSALRIAAWAARMVPPLARARRQGRIPAIE
jgi:hypothetical protein